MSENEAKKRIQAALHEFERRQAPRPKRLVKNNKPEADLVQQLLAHLRANGWSVHCVEAKATFSASAGRYLHGQTVPGFPDICGNMPDGHSCWIEVKAKGRRSTLIDDQREFLLDKIATNAFAVVVDSIELLENFTIEWKKSAAKKAYLLRALPPKRDKDMDSGPLFNEV